MRNRPEKLLHTEGRKWQTEGVLLNLPTDRTLNWGAVFPSREAGPAGRPVEIEIGIGKGTFLLNRARRRPEVDLLGIEYAKAYAAYAADRIRRAGLDNARVLCTNAGPFVARAVPDASVQRVFILFPDPWPKTRHHRRRLIQVPFLSQVRRILQPGGQLLIVTDHSGYFQHISRIVALSEGWQRILFPELPEGGEHVVATNFEIKYAREGRSIHKLALMNWTP
jgi:tRNA (guanine-N7-)-methyltransferase